MDAFPRCTDLALDGKRVDAIEQCVTCLALRKPPATAHLRVTLATNARKAHNLSYRMLENPADRLAC